MVTTDHGFADTSKGHLDLDSVLEAKGLRAKREPAVSLGKHANSPLTDYQNYDFTVMINGNTMDYIYFRDPNGKKTKIKLN